MISKNPIFWGFVFLGTGKRVAFPGAFHYNGNETGKGMGS